MMDTYDRQMERREIRRFKAEERNNLRWDRLWGRAERLIGELCREGRTVYYIIKTNGKTKESGTRSELVAWAIKYGYVGA